MTAEWWPFLERLRVGTLLTISAPIWGHLWLRVTWKGILSPALGMHGDSQTRMATGRIILLPKLIAEVKVQGDEVMVREKNEDG